MVHFTGTTRPTVADDGLVIDDTFTRDGTDYTQIFATGNKWKPLANKGTVRRTSYGVLPHSPAFAGDEWIKNGNGARKIYRSINNSFDLAWRDVDTEVIVLATANPNILDNPLGFIGIIQTQNDVLNAGSATIPLDGFPANRWKNYSLTGGTVSIDADGTFNYDRPLRQFIAEYLAYAGKAILIHNENSSNITFKYGGDGSWTTLAAGSSVVQTWPIGGTDPEYLYIKGESGDSDAWSVKGLKLEESNYRTPFKVPNEVENKVKCKAHFLPFVGQAGTAPLAHGGWLGVTSASFTLSFPTMFETPTLEKSSNAALSNYRNSGSTSNNVGLTRASKNHAQLESVCIGSIGVNNEVAIVSIRENEWLALTTNK